MADSKNIYFLTGEDILKEEFIEDLINKHIAKEAREFNVDVLSGGEITASSLLQRANTLPLFSQQRVIIVKEIEKLKKSEQERLAGMLEQIPSSTIFILSATNKEEMSKEFLKRIKKIAVEKDFAFSRRRSDALQERKQWIEKECQKRGGRISPTALEALAEVPMELRQLRNEIEKLCTFAQGRTITLEDVQGIVTNIEDVKAYELTNAVFEGKVVEAMRLLELLMETGDLGTPLFILGAFASQVRLLLQVKILQEEGIPLNRGMRKVGRPLTQEEILPSIRQLLLEGEDNILQYLQKRPWVGETLEAQARRFSKRSLYVILRLLHRLDQEIKQGADPRQRLEWFIIRVAGVSSPAEKNSASS